MRIRRADVGDAEAIAELFAIVAPEGFIAAEPPVDLEAAAGRVREIVAAGDPSAVWVLEDGDRAVGTASARELVPGVLGLGMLIVPGARGHGGGRALVDAVLAHAADTGAHKVTLEVWPDNARAIALYAAAGFVVEGLKDRHYRRRDGSLRSALLMGRHTRPAGLGG